MVCYAVPLAAWLVTHFGRKTMHMRDQQSNWLSLLLLGGATFGVIDHLWNGELFLVGENAGMDLLLGVAITAGIVVVWGAMVALERAAEPRAAPR